MWNFLTKGKMNSGLKNSLCHISFYTTYFHMLGYEL